MIYQVKDNKKIPLGTQFDNSWQIEYGRDLSSQFSGKSEWTATEDCWFQFHSIWIRQGDSYTNDNAYLSGVQITLNDVNVANMDKSNITNGTTGAVYMITSQLLMKKGDTVKFYSTASTGSQPAFNTTTTHVFPIHRILSKEEGPETVETLLWTNPAPSSSFEKQNITIPTLWDYDRIRVTSSDSPLDKFGTRDIYGNSENEVRLLKADGRLFGRLVTIGPTDSTTSMLIVRRGFFIDQNDTDLHFYDAVEAEITSSKTTITVDNVRNIPYQIFGIKETR